ncbi:MAG: ABC transporter permease [Bacterioplanes sp.]|nr:ABC transporter permease [Bacterioplanes sp.]
MFGNALKLALQAIRRNVLRSFLTTLGIIIGVAAVITMVTLGKGATAQVTAQVASLGSNLLMINRGQGFGPGRDRVSSPAFTLDDIDAIEREVAGLQAVAPMSSSNATLVMGNNSWNSTVRGSSDALLVAGNWQLDQGRIFTADEQASGAAVCVIGQTVSRQLFAELSPLQQSLRVGRFHCEIIGVFKGKGQTTFGQDQDDIVLLPWLTFSQRLAGHREVQQIYISLLDYVDAESVKQRITTLLRIRRHVSNPAQQNFSIMDTAELADTLTNTTRTMTHLLAAVAGVSLLVGGIGIMNIMLVSVTERTREIGTRLAVGALEREVLWQFLVEAVVLSSLGGLMGVLLAIALSFGLSWWMSIPYVFDAGITLTAFAFSALVGVVFGYFPARRAARMNPIDALRSQ